MVATSSSDESAEESELDDPTLALVEIRELVERLVAGQRVDALLRRDVGRAVEGHPDPTASPLVRVAPAVVIAQHPAHDTRRQSDEVGAIIDVQGLSHEAQKGLVNDGGRLEGVRLTFLAKPVARDFAELLVNDGKELADRLLVAAAGILDEERHLVAREICHIVKRSVS